MQHLPHGYNRALYLTALTTVLGLFVLAALSGCAPKSPILGSSSTTPGAPPPSPPGVISEGPLPQSAATAPGAGEGESVSNAPVEHFVTGVIDDAGMGKYYVKLPDGRVLEFPHATADLTGLADTRPGCDITVYYYGEINGADTSGVTVTRMETPN